jgi:hypothetical protein
MALLNDFREGGWAMYPVFIFGLIAVGSAARFAWRGEHQLLGFIRWSVAAVMSMGAFGFVVGMMRALRATERTTEPLRMARIILTGCAEAAHNPAAALMFTVFVCVLMATGQRRFPLPNPSAVAR